MSTLHEAAAHARKERETQARASSEKQREASFSKVEERFSDDYRGFGRLAKDGFEVAFPGREGFEHISYPGYPVFQGGRAENVHGWQVVVDDTRFLFSMTSGSESLYVIHTCPQCQAEGASTFFNLADLGELLARGPKNYAHKCLERESREVAYAIASAARDARVSVDKIIEAALDRHSDLIYRTLAR